MPKRRPPKHLRVFVLVAAVACLGLTMCVFSRKPDPPPPAVNAPAEPSAEKPATAPPAGSGETATETAEPPVVPQQQAPNSPPSKATKKRQVPYFPATKSAGPLR
jgi:hypothetical protein